MKLAIRSGKMGAIKLHLIAFLELEAGNIISAKTSYVGITLLN